MTSNEEKRKVQNKARGYTRGRATKLMNEITGELPNINPNDKIRYTDRLLLIKNDLDLMNKNIFDLYLKMDVNDELLDENNETVQTYDDDILDCIHSLKTFDNQNGSNLNSHPNDYPINPNVPRTRKLELPKIPLPKFSNDKNESFRKFIISFESIVDKHEISSYVKFCYLRDQLSKGPRVLLDSLDVTEQLYEVAKDLLKKAFDNEVESKFVVIKLMTELKLSYNDDPYTFIGDMRTVVAEVESLKIHVDEIIQYFIWQGLNQRFQDHLTSITNKSKPNLKDISDNIFETTNRYNKMVEVNTSHDRFKPKINYRDSGNKQNETVGVNAVDIKYIKFCCLCKQDRSDKNHDIRDCTVYETAAKKVNKLKSIKGCIKCGYSNHGSSNCQYKWKTNCRNCNKEHMTYLCMGNISPSPHPPFGRFPTAMNMVETSTKESGETVNSQSLVEVQHSVGADNIALPTFAAVLINENKCISIRIFKNGGSQRNFITHELARQMNFPMMESNICIDIKGFVSKRSLTTFFFNI